LDGLRSGVAEIEKALDAARTHGLKTGPRGGPVAGPLYEEQH
jgi:hypothetical protein